MRLINWLRASFEGHDGKSSYRRLTTFGIFCLIAYMIVRDQIRDNFTLWAFITLCAVLLLLMGLVTFDQLTRFKNGDKVEGPKFPPPPVRGGDKVEMEVTKVVEQNNQ